MRHVFVWGPAIALMALIFVASSSPDPGGLPSHISDKILHVGAYASLGLLSLRALAGGRLRGITAGRALLAVILTTIYGISDEFHQSFVPGRTPDAMDVVADALGATLGVAALWLIRGWFHPARSTAD